MPRLLDAFDYPRRGIARVDTGPLPQDHHGLNGLGRMILDDQSWYRLSVVFPPKEAVVHQDLRDRVVGNIPVTVRPVVTPACDRFLAQVRNWRWVA